ncbi:GAF sensor signal transduction histidine kinase [Candidatus Koribacter versatilis Ellin345]|uniref:GAF sensor signal transduction histidine kinase n=1 Tax=Koribacter versatilis (strain Ellin345) TaxID=204669 RepID=Q1IIL1_KORVE|nr:GAF domain-containing sensor histidine kinase [Candidatus Koribacter versatilis]ABF43289.1 GAF sensor signal transduction histidine kinase [Candidatus Koribacter versatilis Ellin345]
MPALLPIKESQRAVVNEVSKALQPHFSAIRTNWRNRMFAEFQLDGRAMAALERLTIGTGFRLFCHDNIHTFEENTSYYGKRLAKLQVDIRVVSQALDIYLELLDPYVHQMFEVERLGEVIAALDRFSSATYVAVSNAYFDAQKAEAATLLAVLDAELTAPNLSALLNRVLQVTTESFRASLGVILLRDADAPVLRARANVGFGDEIENLEIEFGHGFSGHIAQTGEPGILPDITESHGRLNPFCRDKAQALWGVPLKAGEKVIGVMLIGFAKPYVWLPTEHELLRAIADRSALAIQRAGMTEALREREARIAELSGYLLRAQEEERKRISRELHDETGQALMVIRLYLGMLEATVTTRTAKTKIHETLEVVDRTIEGIRRIIGRLSPLVLQELGLIAAIRKEAKDLAKSAGVKAKVSVGDNVGRLSPVTETAVYRVVQEALHNVAKHAHATTVTIQLRRDGGLVKLCIEDDGVGIKQSQKPNPGRRSFGLAGMRERITTLEGTLKVGPASRNDEGAGTRIEVTVPAASAGDWHDRGLTLVPGSGEVHAKGAN